tara:strand:- start:1749 stop:1973 length:225 start_codon:yes stop_codon:yes gene_type:complete
LARNYRREYINYDGTPAVKKKRANRNKARRKMVRAGLAKKGDGKDVHHVDKNTRNNSRSNLRVVSASKNRSRRI